MKEGRNMKVRDLMVKELVTAAPSETITQIAYKMREHRVGCIPIVNNGRLCGLITDRDIATKGIAEGLNPLTTRIEAIMVQAPYKITVDAETEEAARVFSQCQVRRLPVVEDGGRLVGMLSVADLALELKAYFDGVFPALAAWCRPTGKAIS
jgi:CBS domain-containing protein